MGSTGTFTLIAGGDVGPLTEPVNRPADLIQPVLKEADFRIAQCERTYSERGFYQEWTTTIPGGKHACLHPRMVSIFQAASIDVVSLASNHALDWGYEPMLDTIDLFRELGMQVIGAGENIEDARSPAILQKNGVKVAILAYCSVLRDGQAAGYNKPGVTPMRATTFYDPIDFQPGSPPRILSAPLEEDIAAMQEDIRKARVIADSVVIFMHWGIRMVPKILATYQQPMAHAAIDAGADLIIGHHSHVPKAVEVYRGKVCFYSIGNFMTNLTDWRERFKSPDWNLIWYKVDPDSLYGFPVDCEKLILPRVVFNNEGVKKVGFLTAHMNKLAQPEVLASSDPRFQEFVEYMEWVSDYVPHSFRAEGNEVIIER